ncbi:uncharacterized protein AAES06_024397 [Glossophaga mutica]
MVFGLVGPSPVASAGACLAASVFSELPSLCRDSFGEVKRAGSSPRLAVHRGSSRNSRPPGRAAPHRWPTLRLPRLQFCAAETARHQLPLSLLGPRFVAGSPWTSVPLSPVSRPSPPPPRVSPQLRRLGHCFWLLAELKKPPRLNAAPADVTAAGDQSAARGPSVNHSASPGRGECGETAFRESVAAASAAPRCLGGGLRDAQAPSCSEERILTELYKFAVSEPLSSAPHLNERLLGAEHRPSRLTLTANHCLRTEVHARCPAQRPLRHRSVPVNSGRGGVRVLGVCRILPTSLLDTLGEGPRRPRKRLSHSAGGESGTGGAWGGVDSSHGNGAQPATQGQEEGGERKQNESWTLRVPEATRTPPKMRCRTLARPPRI